MTRGGLEHPDGGKRRQATHKSTISQPYDWSASFDWSFVVATIIGSGPRRDALAAQDRRSIMSNVRTTRPEAGFFSRMAQLLAATDQFVTWWGDHRAWPANESPRIGRLR
jgi:hypothetical protein